MDDKTLPTAPIRFNKTATMLGSHPQIMRVNRQSFRLVLSGVDDLTTELILHVHTSARAFTPYHATQPTGPWWIIDFDFPTQKVELVLYARIAKRKLRLDCLTIEKKDFFLPQDFPRLVGLSHATLYEDHLELHPTSEKIPLIRPQAKDPTTFRKWRHQEKAKDKHQLLVAHLDLTFSGPFFPWVQGDTFDSVVASSWATMPQEQHMRWKLVKDQLTVIPTGAQNRIFQLMPPSPKDQARAAILPGIPTFLPNQAIHPKTQHVHNLRANHPEFQLGSFEVITGETNLIKYHFKGKDLKVNLDDIPETPT